MIQIDEKEIPTPCPSCGREEGGTWYAPCPADDCPSHWEEKGLEHPEHPGYLAEYQQRIAAAKKGETP